MNGTPKGCTESSRWLASEASVTTGNVISQLLASRLGCKGFGADPRGCAASRLNPWLISLHPFGVISISSHLYDRAIPRAVEDTVSSALRCGNAVSRSARIVG